MRWGGHDGRLNAGLGLGKGDVAFFYAELGLGVPCDALLISGHFAPDATAVPPDGLTLAQTGSTGDLTASKKVRVLTVPMNEVGKFTEAGKKIPSIWKNSLYLEWFSDTNGRVVLEASEWELQVSAPEWTMTSEEEAAAQLAARESLEGWLDCVCDLEKERRPAKPISAFGKEGDMDEFQWEKFMRRSDKITDRYEELIDKFGFENENEIHALMGWGESQPTGEQWEDISNMADIDAINREVDEICQSEAWKDDGVDAVEEQRHPIEVAAHAILQEIDHNEPTTVALWGACATVCAKLAGAFSSLTDDDATTDKGFTIAQLKRCLGFIDTAVEEAGKSSPRHVQSMLIIRQNVIDCQNELRGR